MPKKEQVSVNLHPSLRDWLRDRAKLNRRSLSGEVELILREKREDVTGKIFDPSSD